jgi:hypothetical protein
MNDEFEFPPWFWVALGGLVVWAITTSPPRGTMVVALISNPDGTLVDFGRHPLMMTEKDLV